MATHEYDMRDYSTVKQFCNLALARALNARAADAARAAGAAATARQRDTILRLIAEA